LSVGFASGPAAVVVAAGGGIMESGERGAEHRAFALSVPPSGGAFAVDRGPLRLRPEKTGNPVLRPLTG
jgi:hypothetical protein